MQKHLYELKPGGRFTYGGIEWVALHIVKEVIALATEPVFCRAFDDNNKNDWRNSSLRRELNGPFLDALVQEGAAKSEFVFFESDLAADNGMTDYGTATDVIALLTCDLYRAFRDLIPKVDRWYWTLTPWSCDPEYSSRLCYVNSSGMSSGTLHDSDSYYSHRGVRPLCHLKPEILVSVPDEDDDAPAEIVDEAAGAILLALDAYPANLWGDALGAAVASLFEARREAQKN